MVAYIIRELNSLKSEIDRVKADAKKGDISDDDELFEEEHISGLIIQIEALQDIIVALIKGDMTIEYAKDFLCFDEISKVNYFEGLLTFKKDEKDND